LGKNYYSDGVTFEEFSKKANAEIKRLDAVEELRNAFISVDFSCKGFLTIDDLSKLFKTVAPRLSKNIIT
jgi:Ca2+-binding EF-hand superfamily protein